MRELQRFELHIDSRRIDCSIVQSSWVPPQELTTAAMGFVFDGFSMLFARIAGRDWDLPGGHIERGESPEEAMRREVFEETGAVVGDARLWAHQRIHSEDPVPEGFAYPVPTAYMVFFMAELERLEPFVATEESSEARLFTPTEAVTTPWVQRHGPVYDALLEARRR